MQNYVFNLSANSYKENAHDYEAIAFCTVIFEMSSTVVMNQMQFFLCLSTIFYETAASDVKIEENKLFDAGERSVL